MAAEGWTREGELDDWDGRQGWTGREDWTEGGRDRWTAGMDGGMEGWLGKGGTDGEKYGAGRERQGRGRGLTSMTYYVTTHLLTFSNCFLTVLGWANI